MLPEVELDPVKNKFGVQVIHQPEVKRTLDTVNSRTLEISIPLLSDAERKVNMKTRCPLVQLHSSYSPLLNTFLRRIHINDVCSRCNQLGHTTEYLFKCPSNPTITLTIADLWTNKKKVASFLKQEGRRRQLQSEGAENSGVTLLRQATRREH